MSRIINSFSNTPSAVTVSFGWTPSSTWSRTVNGITMTGTTATVNTTLTFTATATIGNQGNDITGPLTLIEYRWDFGDGIVTYGNPATHLYKLVAAVPQVVLRVTDSKGRYWFAAYRVYISNTSASLPLLLNQNHF